MIGFVLTKLSLNVDKTNFVVFHPFQKKNLTKTIFMGVNQKFIKQSSYQIPWSSHRLSS